MSITLHLTHNKRFTIAHPNPLLPLRTSFMLETLSEIGGKGQALKN